MAKFIIAKDLTEKIYDIIWQAEKSLVIVSPYIKLDDYFRKIFLKHKNNHKLHILIIFGKNEASPSKSLREDDFDFFKQFRNISIVYCKDLHAKYYANNAEGLITSINLYDTCFETNVEYGVSYKIDLLDHIKQSVDTQAWEFTWQLAEHNPAIYVKRPVYDKVLFGLQKNYVDSEVLLDETDSFLNGRRWQSGEKHFLTQYPDELDAIEKNESRPIKEERPKKINTNKVVKGHNPPANNHHHGYCIRTGVAIPFNTARPFCYDAYQSWAQFENLDYPEKFCHATGKPSHGKTSMRKPIL